MLRQRQNFEPLFTLFFFLFFFIIYLIDILSHAWERSTLRSHWEIRAAESTEFLFLDMGKQIVQLTERIDATKKCGWNKILRVTE